MVTRSISVRFEVLRGGGTYAPLQADGVPEVQSVTGKALQMSIRGDFFAPAADINWATDRLCPVLVMDGVEHRMGVFVVTSADPAFTDRGEIWTVEGYSVLYLAERTLLEGTYTIPAGANYIGAVQELLILAGIADYESAATELVLASDRSFEMGTPVLEIINLLLAEINYNPAWVDLEGVVHLTPYAAPSHDNIAHVYRVGEDSIVLSGHSVSSDRFGKANVFKAVCSSPDLDAPLVAVSENNDPSSPFSIENLGGRVLHVETVDSVPDLATLQAIADRLMMESKQTEEIVSFTTGLDAGHDAFATVALDLGSVSGIFTEIEWRCGLDASGTMSHRARRVVLA